MERYKQVYAEKMRFIYKIINFNRFSDRIFDVWHIVVLILMADLYPWIAHDVFD